MLRHSSRQMIRSLGILDGQVTGCEVTPTQCHILTELAAHGRLAVGELARLLEVDKSTASRGVTVLVEGGLVQTEVDSSDARNRLLHLSSEGRARVEKIHAAADTQVRAALELLSEQERKTVLRGVSLYEKALHRSQSLAAVSFRPIAKADEPTMAGIIRSVMGEFNAVGCGFSIEDPEVDSMHDAYAGDRAAYFVAQRGNQLIAGAGIAQLSEGSAEVCELKKMYAMPSARGLGVGEQLLAICLDAARTAGFKRCYLETLGHMSQARLLYKKAGFLRIDRPMGNTGHHGCDHWYVLEL